MLQQDQAMYAMQQLEYGVTSILEMRKRNGSISPQVATAIYTDFQNSKQLFFSTVAEKYAMPWSQELVTHFVNSYIHATEQLYGAAATNTFASNQIPIGYNGPLNTAYQPNMYNQQPMPNYARQNAIGNMYPPVAGYQPAPSMFTPPAQQSIFTQAPQTQCPTVPTQPSVVITPPTPQPQQQGVPMSRYPLPIASTELTTPISTDDYAIQYVQYDDTTSGRPFIYARVELFNPSFMAPRIAIDTARLLLQKHAICTSQLHLDVTYKQLRHIPDLSYSECVALIAALQEVVTKGETSKTNTDKLLGAISKTLDNTKRGIGDAIDAMCIGFFNEAAIAGALQFGSSISQPTYRNIKELKTVLERGVDGDTGGILVLENIRRVIRNTIINRLKNIEILVETATESVAEGIEAAIPVAKRKRAKQSTVDDAGITFVINNQTVSYTTFSGLDCRALENGAAAIVVATSRFGGILNGKPEEPSSTLEFLLCGMTVTEQICTRLFMQVTPACLVEFLATLTVDSEVKLTPVPY